MNNVNMKKIYTALLILTIMMTSSAVQALENSIEVTFNVIGNKVEINGKVTPCYPNEKISILISYPTKGILNENITFSDNIIAYYDIFENLEANGDFSFTTIIPETNVDSLDNGDYNVLITAKVANTKKVSTIYKVNQSYINERLKQLNEASSYIDLISIYTMYKKFFNKDIEKNSEFENQVLFSALNYYIKKNTLTKVEDIDVAYSYAENVKNIISNINTATYGEMTGLISDITTLFGIDLPSNYNSIKSEVCKKMTGKVYVTISDVKDAFDKAVEEVNKLNNVKGGGGGGSSMPVANKIITTNTAITPITMPVPVFGDLHGFTWAEKDIYNLVKEGIILGKSNDIFAPNLPVTREEFAKVIVLKFNMLNNLSQCSFVDVDKNMWYYQYISSAYENKLMQGLNDNQFGVGQNITRQDVAAILARSIGKAYLAEHEKFVDDSSIDSYASYGVYLLKQKGILRGYEDNTFRPKSVVTRAEMAVMINKITIR